MCLLVGGVAALSAETAIMTDQRAEAFRPSALWAVLTGSRYGLAIGARLGLAGVSLVVSLAVASLGQESRGFWAVLALVGAAASVSFAWTGHGAMDEGTSGLVHLVSDIIHLFAAGLWLGALAALAAITTSRRIGSDEPALQGLEEGLRRFSGLGTLAVCLLMITGLINSWFLIGPDHMAGLFGSLYGEVLIAKLLLFVLMLALAALNRFFLTPRLSIGLVQRAPQRALVALGWSVGLETAVAMAVLGLVSVLGTLSPLSMPM